ncbi:hypothetical protein MSG28_003795 [Choristoneura fumiferana]|uniref:Uncharacterized protein n=1 Tax=Choristoneura fumiferana TaxID=7141 RepID=A0ACC0KG83_CHOFU|nr:hypothetical protein MSG28_003795 [Choristoneura fumiferana]
MSLSAVKNPGHTGYFRDGIRRIDMILTLRDDGQKSTESIKIEYLTNIVQHGLILELEPGVMAIHKHLIFVKIHAPASVLDMYGPKFNVTRYFKANHLEFINPKELIYHILRFLNFSESHEKEWVRLVRQQYPRPKCYSTLERSMIVYKMLLKVRFGDPENYVGLQKLLDKRIILDAFPLHDGPFFAVPKQEPHQFNARQILNYNWVGIGNILKSQPLNLIHEYFGDRVAFFFAFYGFYTFFLIIPAVIGGVAIIPEIFNNTVEMKYTYTDILAMKVKVEDHEICPRCRHFEVCPFLPFKFYRNAIKYNNIFDKESVDMIPVYITVWATLLMIFWRRTESYWMWMWECDPWISKVSERAQYHLKKKEKQLGYKMLILIVNILLCTIAAIAYCCLFIGLALGLMFLQNYAIRKFVPKYGFDLGHYKALTIFYTMNVIIMIILEKIWSIISYKLNKFLNHKCEHSYDKSLVATLFGLTIPTTCVLFIYIGFFKARIFTHYEDSFMYDTLDGIFMTQCNPVGCSDELALALCVTVILKECFMKMLWNCYHFIMLRTDYNQGILLNMDAPCWEREYRLPTLKDDFIHDKMKSLGKCYI